MNAKQHLQKLADESGTFPRFGMDSSFDKSGSIVHKGKNSTASKKSGHGYTPINPAARRSLA